MKNSKSILEYFKVQHSNLTCPACGISLPKARLNIHLDTECSSSVSSTKISCETHSKINFNSMNKCKFEKVDAKSQNISKMPDYSKANSSKSGRLSLKQQKINKLSDASNKKSFICSKPINEAVEVITLDDNSYPSEDEVKDKAPFNEIKCKKLSSPDEHLIKKSTTFIPFEKDLAAVPTINSKEQSDLCHSGVDNVQEIRKIGCENKLMLVSDEHESVKIDRVHKSEKKDRFHKSVVSNSHESTNMDSIQKSEKIDGLNNSETVEKVHKSQKIDNKYESVILKKKKDIKPKKLSKTNKNTVTTKQPLPTVINNSVEEDVAADFKKDNLCNNSRASLGKSSTAQKTFGDSEVNADIIAVLNDVEDSLEADNNVFTEDGENTEKTEKYYPYYIANFKYILNGVLNDDFNKILFNKEDMAYVQAFETSSDAAQKLYVRLFQRKYKWLRLDKINYPNISKDMKKVLDELVAIGLVDAGLENIDLDTALDLLSLSEARIVAKQFKLNLSGKSKADISHLLMKHCKEHKSVFFCNGKNSISNMMLKKVKDVLGPCYRISLLPKRLFSRILMLFSLPTISEDDDDAAGGQQLQLLTLLQVNKGELTFPSYKINRQMMIFTERDELIRYEEAKQLENDIMNAAESRNLELAKQLYINAKEEFEEQLASSFVERPASLPSYLKKYSSFHIYIRCMTQGVEIHQRLREYKEAVELLKRLLSQKVFAQDYRGRWYDRLALNLEMHLKQREEALEAIAEGIKDKNVRVGHRHSLLIRGLRILKYVKAKDELKNEIEKAASVIEAPKVVIKGQLFPRNILGRRHVFISSSAVSDEDDITVLGVEQLAIEHYKSEGFTEGIHGESSTFHCLYGLLFWDIIYDGEIPDAFISPYQTHPLDLNHESFFKRREQQILSHLKTLRSSTIEELKNIVKSTWEAHFGESSLVFWDRFTGVDHILGLVSCMGNNLVSGICERLARDFRFTRSGIPDLVVWNPETLQVKIVEVKGPGDKLSTKQILWLDYLLKLGAEAEVCHVEAVGSKKLRKE